MEYLLTVILATVAGSLARWYMLRRDYRQYPSYPQGWAIHLFLGFIGALIGAILVPSFLERDFSAMSFLLLAATQFREVRNMERNTLAAIEPMEMVARGNGYIEGIARVFEARNYLAIWVSFAVAITSELLAGYLLIRIGASVIVGFIIAYALNRFMRGEVIQDIADVELTDITFEGPIIVAGGIYMMNIGLEDAQNIWLKQGLAASIKPNGPNAKATLSNIGQMQAIVHDVFAMVGVYMDVGEQEFTPIVRRDPETGTLVLIMIPSEQDAEAFLEAVRRVPILESAIRKPLLSQAGKMID